MVLPTPSRPEVWANYGGPMSRTRTERIKSTILGGPDGPFRCPLRGVLALHFGDAEPVAAMYGILCAAGLDDPEQLRAVFGKGILPMVCRAAPDLVPLDVGANAADVLRQAFFLGLCTNVLFDPSRPVLWTQASLTRRLELFDLAGFYS